MEFSLARNLLAMSAQDEQMREAAESAAALVEPGMRVGLGTGRTVAWLLRASKGYSIVYVGHEGHEEAVGTMAVAPQSVRLIEHEADLEALEDLEGAPVALLAQTTLSHDEWRGLMESARERYPDLWMPNRSDLCFATTNRQAALRKIAATADAVVVIGSANSSNTVALTKVAEAVGCPRVLRVNGAFEVPDDLSGVVAVIAPARLGGLPWTTSTPSSSVRGKTVSSPPPCWRAPGGA